MTNRGSNSTRCHVCGKQVPLDAALCPHCGAALTQIRQSELCPSCGARMRPDEEHCPICGAHRPVSSPLPASPLTVILGALALAALVIAVILLRPGPEVVTALLPTGTPTVTVTPTASRTASSTATSTAFPSPTMSHTPSPTATPTSEYALYVAKLGDSVTEVARAHGITAAELRALNGLEPNAELIVGQELAVPRLADTATPTVVVTLDSGRLIHVVQAGENLLRIAAKYGVSVASILEANDLAEDDVLNVGQELVIVGASSPVGDGAPSSTPTARPSPTEPLPVTYIVVAGDYLGKIAARFGIDEDDLARANGITSESILSIGQELIIPRTVATPVMSPTPSAVPSETPTPTLVPSSTPTPTPTYDLPSAPTPLPVMDHAQPCLLAPAEGSLVSGATPPLLNWTSSGILDVNEYYLVRVWYGPERTQSLTLRTQSTAVRLPAELYPGESGAFPFYWQVVVVRRHGEAEIFDAVSLASAVRSFTWR